MDAADLLLLPSFLLALGAIAQATRAVVRLLRKEDARARALARSALRWFAALIVLVFFGPALVAESVQPAEATSRASVLARGIAASMNGGVLGISALPIALWVLWRVRSRRN
jgi:uncharacterized membrane protein (DUF485 family)